ncbi:MAG TPA: malto-oligosyltrehalose synthase, partial [Tepidisphaeraceae bacterium]
LNPELSPEHYEKLLEALAAAGMSHLLDIVPNHMGVDTNENAWWNDVLTNGPASKYAKYFDIAWHNPARPDQPNKLLLPVLGDQYGVVLKNGDLKLAHENGKFYIAYFDRRFPVSPRSYPTIRSGASTVAKQLEEFNGTPGEAETFDALDQIIQQQHYRLAWYKTASDEINYRRFFHVNSLAALAAERPEVFDASHALILKGVAAGQIAGLRIDHPDGLYDPLAYLTRLQQQTVLAVAQRLAETDPAFKGITFAASRARLLQALEKAEDPKPLYVSVEKILAMDEPLPDEWPVDGTSGYDFLIHVNSLFVDTQNDAAMTKIYQQTTGVMQSVEEICYEAKLGMIDNAFNRELNSLTALLDDLAQQGRSTRDFTFQQLKSALRAAIAAFGVYRTYITAAPVTDRDRQHVERALAKAAAIAPRVEASALQFIGESLLRTAPGTDVLRNKEVLFAGKFQQLTSPVTAKGIEDTAFYRYHRLISLNEVGGEPAKFGIEPDSLHAYFAERQSNWPLALSTLSTHDTKRSEDVRARISVLSEIPEEWQQFMQRVAESGVTSDLHPNDAYLLLQTLLGAWPWQNEADFAERVKAYMIKALREADERTTYTRPDEAYEAKVTAAVTALTQPDTAFQKDFLALHTRVRDAGVVNSLAQTVLKYWAPGVPDTYQGTELWDLSLVDPDNRRPVNYETRRSLLASLDAGAPEETARRVTGDFASGAVKLWVTTRSLAQRKAEPDTFRNGKYVPLNVNGPLARNIFAFARQTAGASALVIVPRLTAKLGEPGRLPTGAVWGDTAIALPDDLAKLKWQDAFTGRSIGGASSLRVAELLDLLPVAGLIGR